MQSHTPAPATPIILVVGGGDSRKNPEVAVIAHARSWRLAAAGIPLLVAGDYPECMQRDLRQLHAMSDGNPQLLEFLPSVPDEELQSCYARALCTVAPSRIEGFSIPIIEASANGCPVLASKCAAQAELLTATEDLFDPDDAETLRERLEQIVLNPAARKAACARQSDIWRRFTLEEVGNRFWQAMIAGWEASAPAVLRGKRPSIAFLSPLPPAVSGVADYSFAMLSPLAARADVEVFSGTADARTPRGVRVMGSTNALAHLESRFDAVITIIGNSHIHIPEFELLLRYGGAAIAHDARMVDFYRFLLSEDRALAVASDELGRPVDRDELNTWLADQGRLEALFLKEIAEAARPICVHSPITARYIAERYGITPVKLPFVPYRNFRAEDISPTARLMARDRLGIGHNEVIVASFGMVHPVKALEDCLWVLEILRAWKIPARLVFVGETPRDFSKWLFETARAIGVMEALTVFERPVPEQEYRLWLVAADVGLQLRIYQLGGLSGAILDCMAAALPTVANAHLAEACEAPSYMQCVPDAISAVLVAETIASIIDKGQHLHRPIPERDAMLETRNFDVYTECLLNALGAQ